MNVIEEVKTTFGQIFIFIFIILILIFSWPLIIRQNEIEKISKELNI